MDIFNDKISELTQDDLDQLSKIIYSSLGIVINKNKKQMLYRRLSKRLLELQFTSFGEYIDYIKLNEDEYGYLANAVTTNFTGFFREPHHFEFLEMHLRKLQASGLKKIRIWSAGCSNGSEPYSIALVANNCVNKDVDLKILATDIDTSMLQVGHSGVYPIEVIEKIPQKYHSLFDENDKNIVFKDKIRHLISFKRLNLLHKWPITIKFDIIFCRNVVIYFDKDTQRVIFDNFADHIKQKGVLFIGHSENIHNITQKFTSIGRTTYERI